METLKQAPAIDLRFRRYLLVFVAAFAAAFFVVAIFAYSTKMLGIWHAPYNDLLNYQREKIARERNVQGVLLGDSSLGNAVNAKLLSDLSGTKWLNLALTGNHGFAGAYNLLRQTLERQPLERVILMGNPELMSTGAAWRGYFFTSRNWKDIASLLNDDALTLPQRLEFLKTIFVELYYLRVLKYVKGTLVSLLSKEGSFQEHIFEDDYIRQGPPISIETFDHSEVNERVQPANPEKMIFINKIAWLCRERELSCYYAHGPLFKPINDAAGPILKEYDRHLSDTGIINLTPDGHAMPENEVGDRLSHLAPQFRDKHTYWLFGRWQAAQKG